MLEMATMDQQILSDNLNRGRFQDEKVAAMFNEEAIPDPAASAEAGRPIYRTVDFIMIMVPGDKDSIIHRKASQEDKDRFARQYAAFKAKQSQEAAAGTPLRAVTFLTSAQIKELAFFNCFTVEQLAALPDSGAKNFMGIQKFKQLAQDFLKAAEGMAPITQLREKNIQLEAQLAETTKALTDLAAEMAMIRKGLADQALAQNGKVAK